MDNEGFANDVNQMTICTDSVENFVDQFETEIEKLLNTHAPMKEKIQICRAPKPWFSESIMSLKRVMRRSERLWRKHRQPKDYEIYKCALHKYHYELRNVKQLTLSQKVIESKGNSKKLYQFVKDLTGSKSENPMSPVEDENTHADKFADHFMDKIKKIRESLKYFENY
ncbi:uncharacterized protein LOC132744898 [Ruditapes philippinarum]|uniref:uncharacterized protein LOC132744898 n=1 Tax=Ruditapes philippinarum TaxID=129788 RepID=UPI00295C1747|nr:uncharacterized protein LOC132744898 [Ruditapes philippinarum]